MSKITNEQGEQDSIILGTIIAGATKKSLRQGHVKAETDFTLCAIGAGIIGEFIGEKIPGTISSAIKLFSTLHNVSLAYAKGVNDGFEQDLAASPAVQESNKSNDYYRGWNVGEAANIQRTQRK